MAAELFKASLVALVAIHGAHIVYDWLGARGGLFPELTDINAGEFFPALFTVAMIAGILT